MFRARISKIFENLSRAKHVNENQWLSISRIVGQVDGFAYECWASDGDLQDIESLINCVVIVFS